ncbi:MAG TPA: hypothetical protein VKU00_17950 [Chthonomonadaceae bacterium]|nr:hypothetical protein [Chthonomonadaceae bacterium]
MQTRHPLTRRLCLFGSLCALGVLAGVARADDGDEGHGPRSAQKDHQPRAVHTDKVVQTVTLSFNESFRLETMTTHGGISNITETRTASGGKLTINAEMPLDIAHKPFDANTKFLLQMGNFKFDGRLGDDLQFQPGKTSATLKMFASTSTSKSRVLLATIQLKWDHDKLTVKVDAKIPESGRPAVADDLTTGKPGELEGETDGRIQFADQTNEFTTPFQGRLQRKTANSIDSEGEVDIVSLHGEVKPDK